MPRMHVNLRPSTIQFDDGEDPIVSGVARFGTTMAKLPLQMAQLRMQQQEQQDHRDEFSAMQQLRMNADAREQDVHPYEVAGKRGAAIESGAYMPHPDDEQMLTADDQNDQLLREHGEEKRQADLEHLRGGGHSAKHFAAIGDKLNGVYVYDQNTGEGKFADDGTGTLPPPPHAPAGDDRGLIDRGLDWVDERMRTQPPAAGAHGGHPFAGHGPDHAQDPDAALHKAMRQHDAGNPGPLRDMMVQNPQISQRVRAMALADKSAPAQGTPFQLPRMGP